MPKHGIPTIYAYITHWEYQGSSCWATHGHVLCRDLHPVSRHLLGPALHWWWWLRWWAPTACWTTSLWRHWQAQGEVVGGGLLAAHSIAWCSEWETIFWCYCTSMIKNFGWCIAAIMMEPQTMKVRHQNRLRFTAGSGMDCPWNQRMLSWTIIISHHRSPVWINYYQPLLWGVFNYDQLTINPLVFVSRSLAQANFGGIMIVVVLHTFKWFSLGMVLAAVLPKFCRDRLNLHRKVGRGLDAGGAQLLMALTLHSARSADGQKRHCAVLSTIISVATILNHY